MTWYLKDVLGIVRLDSEKLGENIYLTHAVCHKYVASLENIDERGPIIMH